MTGASPLRRLYRSGGSWEDAFGYSRAIRTGDRIIVSGCTSAVDGAVQHAGDAGGQMRVALEHVLEAITALGGTLGDVIQTRIYVVNRADCDAIGRVHGERFADVHPAATMVLVAGLLDEEMLVEVEVEARIRSAKPYDHRG
ncbi:MAG TPA: Rid family hydrolase [Dermatophilaceae bacterium]|nr:Rid family hydrolase [Dermatophilaceae bacterium]